jgi:Protein of unknown function (DUF559)
VVDRHVGRRLVRVLPHVYTWRGTIVDDRLLLRAALLHAGPGSVLSHTTALHVWGVRRMERPVHVTIEQTRRRAGSTDVVVHRRLRFDADGPQAVDRGGLLVTPLARSLIDSWPLLPVVERRPLVLDVYRQGLTAPLPLREALAERPNVGGHRELARAIDLIDDGCQSELEVLGVLNVFRHPSLPRGIGQYRVSAGGKTYHLDRAWPDVKVAVELDGARHHTSPEDRARDLARDAALAAIGWLVLRFTYAQVRTDPDGVRQKVLDVVRVRRTQLSAS